MSTPLDDYKKIVDDLVHAAWSPSARWVREKRRWPDGAENVRINELIDSLSDEKREVLARILEGAVQGGIHKVLAYLTDEMNLAGLRITKHGREIPVEPYGTEMYYDWVCRLNGDEWPDLPAASDKD